MSKIYDYIVTSKEASNKSTLVISLRSQGKRRQLNFKPGQYAAISFLHHGQPTVSRCFSITSSPAEDAYLQFAIHSSADFQKIAAESLLPGTRVMIEGPYGELTFNPERDKAALLIAEGIGVAPFMSMLRYAAQKRLSNELNVIYSSEHQEDMPFLAELREIEQANPHLKIAYVINSGSSNLMYGENILNGEISGALFNQMMPDGYSGKTVFLSGPSSFTNKVTQKLLGGGNSIESIITENIEHGQTGPRTISHKVSLQVYALTGLSLVLGTAVALPRTASTGMASLSSSDVNDQTGSDSSRQKTVNQTINKLIAGGTNAATTNSSGNSSSSSGSVASTTSTAPSTTKSSTTSTNSGSTSSSTSKKSASTTTKSSTTSTNSGSTSSSTSKGSTTGSGTTSSGTGSSGSSGSGSSGTTTPPKPTPIAPSLTFQASTTSITSGQSVTLSWSINSSATTPVTCTASGGWSGSKVSSGSSSVKPSSTTTYSLTCSNTAGSSSRSATVTVEPACVSTASNPC